MTRKKKHYFFKQVNKDYAVANTNGFTGNNSKMVVIDEKAHY